jgi:excisionase family DNA binding protein
MSDDPVVACPSFLVKIKEATRLLDCSEGTIRNLVRTGALRSVRLGRGLWFQRADLEQLAEGSQWATAV